MFKNQGFLGMLNCLFDVIPRINDLSGSDKDFAVAIIMNPVFIVVY